MKKIKKDVNAFVNFRLATILLVLILLAIAAPLFWFFMFQKKKKAPPIINNPYNTESNSPTANNKNLLLTATQTDESQPVSGYQFAQIGQPCNKNEIDKGLANLPASYIPLNCDTTKNLICTTDNFQGDICLANTGGYCDTVNDCIDNSNLCLNNICSQSGETLNRKCIRDSDCQALLDNISENTVLFNHVCDIEKNKNYGFCKVNNYPFDSGCNSNNECLSGYTCSKTLGSFDISIAGGGSWFAFDTEGKNIFQSFDLNNKIVLINNNTYQIENWNNLLGNGILKLVNSTFFPPEGINNNKLSLGAAKDGICLGKIPEAGPANLTIGGICIPCQDGLQNINDYCLSTTTPNIEQVCVDGANICQDYNVNGVAFGLSCLYDYNTEQNLINDYYYTIEGSSFSKSLFNSGKCARPVQDRGQACNSNFYGCSFPYICIAENNEEGNIVNICNIPFESQICVNNNCPPGYECKFNSDNEPLCYSKSGTMCIDYKDCINSNCGTDSLTLQVYNPEDTKIKKLIWPASQNNQTIRAYNPKLNENIIPNSKELVVANNILSWWVNFNYLNIILLQGNNTIIKKGFLNFSSGTIIKDVVMDEDENIIILYKRPVTETMRERVFKMDIGSNIFITKEFNLDQLNGLLSGTVVYYFYNGSNSPALDSSKLYKLTINTGTLPVTYGLTEQDGTAVSYSNGAVGDGHHWLITYDNNYKIGSELFSAIPNFALSRSYDPENENNRYLQLNTGDRITPSNPVATINYQLPDGTNAPVNKTHTMDFQKNYYLTAMGKLYPQNINFDASELSGTINTNNPDAIYYTFSDDYYYSIGGFPSLDNNKTFHQTATLNIDDENYFVLNFNNLYTYSITTLRTTDLLDDTENYVTNENYVYDNNEKKFNINGINQGITFLYNGADDIEINTKKIDNQNYLILNKGISTAVDNNAGSKYINQIMKYQYNIEYDLGPSISSKNSFDYVFKTKHSYTNNAGTCYSSFYFNYPEVTVVDESKGFYHSIADGTNRDNNIENISINENESIFYTLKSADDLYNNIENTVGINSGYTKLDVSRGSVNDIEPDINYQSDEPNIFSNLKPLEFSSLVNLINRKGNENYYIDDNNYIYIYDQTDIDNILNFSSSELVLTKLGDTAITRDNTNFLLYPGNANDSLNQLTLAITEISEYNVTVDSEYIKAKIHIDINYEETKYILDSSKPWQLNVYNYVPLQFYAYFNNLTLADDNNGSRNVSSFTYNINDASLLYSSTKGTSFFDNNKNNKLLDGISRTGYNKILTLDAQEGYDTSSLTININSTRQDTGSIYYVTDGAGVFMKKMDTGGGWGSDNKVSQPQNFYNITSQISGVSGSFVSNNNMITCYPSNVPYQNFLVLKGNNTYDILKYANESSDSNNYYGTGTSIAINQFNSFFGDRFFAPFVPISEDQLNHANGNYIENPDEFNYVPLRTQQPPGPTVYDFPQDTTQFILSTNQIITAHNNAKFYYRQLYSGTIKLPFINLGGTPPDNLLFTVNNIFLTSFDTNTWYLNSNSYKKDNIIITTTTDKNGKTTAMVKGNIPTYQNMMAHYQTGTPKPDDALNKSNQVAISWPSWFKTRFDNKLSVNNAIPKIRRVIIDHSNGNTYGNANYYAFVETEDQNTILVYLNNENTNYNLGENQGVPTTVNIYENNFDANFLENNFVMSSPSKLLYILSNVCN